MDAQQAKALREPFPPEQIGKLPRAGIKLDYVGHAATTSRILEVDPEWTWKPMNVDEHGAPILTLQGLSPQTKMGLWIEMTIAGVTRPGFGDGNTIKECISDAIRNAAMRFGVALDLWAKEDLHSDGSAAGTAVPRAGKAVEAPAPRPAVPAPDPAAAPNGAPKFATEAQRKRLFAIAKENRVEPAQLRTILEMVTGQQSTSQIPAGQYDAVVKAVELAAVPFE